MSMSEIINSIEREMFDRAAREENTEMVDVTILEDDTNNARRYIKGRRDNCKAEV